MSYRRGATLLALLTTIAVGAWGQEASSELSSEPVQQAAISSFSRPIPVTPNAVMAESSSLDSVMAGSLPVAPAILPNPVEPVVKKEKLDKNYARDKKIWYSLVAAQHSAAFFDAWSTRSAVNRGARETNPFLRPFANSGAMYPAAQAFPAAMDYVGYRMMRSNNRVMRKLWWVPQAVSTVASFTAGIHNLGVKGSQY
jgi:hypothetical protein